MESVTVSELNQKTAKVLGRDPSGQPRSDPAYSAAR